MKYKAIFCDFDGTLLRDDHTVSEVNKQAIAQYVSQGGKFIISTGRIYSAMEPYLQDLGLVGDMINTQGAEIYDIQSAKCIWFQKYTISQAVEVLEYCESNDYAYPMLYADDVCYVQESSHLSDIFAKITGLDLVYVNGKLSQFISQNNIIPSKILTLMDGEYVSEFMKIGKQVLGDKYEICKSQYFLTEILRAGINKGSAVKYLCNKYGISLDEIICIGDSENDISMLKIASLAVAMDNAYDNVKAVADYIAPSNNDDGVANVIQKFCQ